MPLLVEQRVITEAFRAALESYVTSYADMVRGELLKAESGFSPYVVEMIPTSEGERERLKPHPVVKMTNDAKKELRQWAGVLGLLPTTVGKVSAVAMATPDDEDDVLLARMEGRAFGVVNGGRQH